MEIITSPDENLMLMGVLLVSEGIPSFGTPIFRHPELNHNFIQSSAKGKSIDSFYPVRDMPYKSELFKYIGSNEPIRAGTPFLLGFIDIEQNIKVYTRKELYKKIDQEFELYCKFPFLQWTMITLFNSEKFLKRLTDQNMSLLVREFSKHFTFPATTDVLKNLGLGKPDISNYSPQSNFNDTNTNYIRRLNAMSNIPDLDIIKQFYVPNKKIKTAFNWSEFLNRSDKIVTGAGNSIEKFKGITPHFNNFNLYFLRERMRSSKTNT